MLTWNEAKRQTNIANHGFDFAGAEAIFDHPVLAEEDDREAYGEQRINVIGWLHGRMMFFTYRDDGDDVHAISLREAEPYEIKRYQKILSKHRL